MAKDIRIIFSGDTSRADAAIKSLERTGTQAASILEREFNQLGIKSAVSFDNQRKAATTAYDKIKSSGLATASELERAQKAHASAMTRIDEAEHGKRISLHEKLKTNWLAITASVAAAWAVASKAITLAQSGAAFSQQGTSFANLAAASGASADKMIADLRRVSGETVSVQQLVEKAGTAMLLGVESKMIPKLMEVARASSRITGQTVSEAFGDISLAVARQSRMILDNLGILVDVDKANKDYAVSLGKTAEQLTDAEKKQAFLNATLAAGEEIIAKVGKQAETDADKFAKFSSSIDNIGKSVGILLSGPMADLSGEMASTVGWLEAYKSGQVGFWEYMTTGADAAAEKLKKLRTTNLDASATPEGVDFARRKAEAEALRIVNENIAKSYEDLGIKTSKSFDEQRAAALNAYDTIKTSGRATADELVRAEKAYHDKIKKINEEQTGITAEQEKQARDKKLADIRSHNARLLDVEKKRIDKSLEQELTHLKTVTAAYSAADKARDDLAATRAATAAQFSVAKDALNPATVQNDPYLKRLSDLDNIGKKEQEINNDWKLSAEEKAKKLAALAVEASTYNTAVILDGYEVISQLDAQATGLETIERLQREAAKALAAESLIQEEAFNKSGAAMLAAEVQVKKFTTEIETLESVLDRLNNKEINIIFKAQNAAQVVAAAGGSITGLETTALPTTSFHSGTRYVPRSGLYPLARGEQVLNRDESASAEEIVQRGLIKADAPVGRVVREIAEPTSPEEIVQRSLIRAAAPVGRTVREIAEPTSPEEIVQRSLIRADDPVARVDRVAREIPRPATSPSGNSVFTQNMTTAPAPTINVGGITVTVDGTGKSGPQIGDEIGEAAARKLYVKFREFDRRYRSGRN